MKKYFIYIIFLLLLPFMVHAEVEITNIDIVDKTPNLEVAKPTYEGLKLNVDIKFQELNNFVKYKITIKNDTKKEYELSIGTEFSKGEYIKYEYSYVKDEEKTIKPNKEKELYLTVTYNKEIPLKEYKNGKYNEKNNMIINLSNEETNPKTSVGIYVLIAIVCLAISTTLIMLIKNKMNTIPLTILLLLIIPVSIYALEKLTIEIDTNITIISNEKNFTIYTSSCDLSPAKEENIKYLAGMTWEEFLNSDYKDALEERIIDSINNDTSLRVYKKEFIRCVEEVEYVPYNVNYTGEQLEKYQQYKNHYDECENRYGGEMSNNKNEQIKPQEELVYQVARTCE